MNELLKSSFQKYIDKCRSNRETDPILRETYEESYRKSWMERLIERESIHLQEMANSKISSSVNVIINNIGNPTKGWDPEKALKFLVISTGENNKKCTPIDDNNNPIDKTTWVIQILNRLKKSIEVTRVLQELRDKFPHYFSGLQVDRLKKEINF